MAINTENIVSVLNRYNVDIKLTDAFKVASDIMSEVREDRDEQYTKGYNAGKTVPDYPALDAQYDKGYTRGLEDGKRQAQNSDEQYELKRLRHMEKKMVEMANKIVIEVVAKVGRDKKIQCIKELRERTWLGLKDAKEIVDAECKRLDMEDAYAEKEKKESENSE